MADRDGEFNFFQGIHVRIDIQGPKKGFTTSELRTVFGKLRIEITNLLENREIFWWLNSFSCQVILLTLHGTLDPHPPTPINTLKGLMHQSQWKFLLMNYIIYQYEN